MEWTSDLQSGWLGDEAPDILKAAFLSSMIDEWPRTHARRFRLRSGEALWCRLTPKGSLCSIVACPWGLPVDGDTMPLADLYFQHFRDWPPGYRTKQEYLRAAGLDKYADRRGQPHDPYRVGGLCVAMHDDKRTVSLHEVYDLDDTGDLVSVLLDPGDEASEMPIAALPQYVRWWPLDTKHEEGGRILLGRQSPYSCHNWRLLTMQCANAVRPPGKKRQGAPASPEPDPPPPRGRKTAGKATAARERRGDTIDDIMAWPEWPAMTDRAEAVVMRHPDDTVAQAHAKIRAALKAEWPWLTDRHLDLILE